MEAQRCPVCGALLPRGALAAAAHVGQPPWGRRGPLWRPSGAPCAGRCCRGGRWRQPRTWKGASGSGGWLGPGGGP